MITTSEANCYLFIFICRTIGDQQKLRIYLNLEKLQGCKDTVAQLKPIFFPLCLYIYNFRSLRLLCFHYDLLLPWEAKSLILLDSLWVLPACIWGLFCVWKQSVSETKNCFTSTFFVRTVLYWILPAWHYHSPFVVCNCIVLCVYTLCCQVLSITGLLVLLKHWKIKREHLKVS